MTGRATAPDDDDGLLAAEYALGVIRGAERDALSARIARDPAFAALVRQWDEHFVTLSEGIVPVASPARVQAALERRLFGSGTRPPPAPFWNSVGLWRGLAIASIAALVTVGAWTLRPAQQAATGVLVAQLENPGEGLTVLALFDESRGELRLNRLRGSAATGRSLEVWLIAGQDPPISLGVLSEASESRVAVPLALQGRFAGGVLAISDEPPGGSPTGAPTGAVLAAVPLTSI